MQMRIGLLDDEYPALQVLQAHIRRLNDPAVQVAWLLQDPRELAAQLEQDPVDLLLLDIHMPWLNGLRLLRSLPNPPATVFTTAYSDHALDAYGLDVVDYLTKPISYERLLQCLEKVRVWLRGRTATSVAISPTPPTQVLTLRVDGDWLRLPIANIEYLEGWQEYVRIHTRDGGKVIVYDRLKNLLAAVPGAQFLQVHRSYVVALDALVRFNPKTGTLQLASGAVVRVSRQCFTRLRELMRN